MEIKNFIFLTEIIVFSGIFLTLIFYLFSKRYSYYYGLTIISHIFSLISEIFLLRNNVFGIFYFLNFSYETRIFSIILIFSSFLSILILLDYDKKEIIKKEFFLLNLNSLFAMLLIIHSHNLFLFFFSIEYLFFTIYIALFSFKEVEYPYNIISNYLLFSFVSSIIMLFGIFLIYLNSGSLSYTFLKEKESLFLYFLSFLFLFAGLFLKFIFGIFHFATFFILESLPFPFILFILTCPIVSFFSFLFSFNKEVSFNPFYIGITSLLIISLFNIILIFEKKLKRILALSTILHAGYMLLIFTLESKFLFEILLFYLLTYIISHSGILLCFQEFNNEKITIYDLKDKGSLLLSFSSLLFLLSLTGIPPTGGFYAKFFMLGMLISEGYEIFAFIGFLNSALSSLYYIKIISEMFKKTSGLNLKLFSIFLILTFASFIFLLGIYPVIINFLIK